MSESPGEQKADNPEAYEEYVAAHEEALNEETPEEE